MVFQCVVGRELLGTCTDVHKVGLPWDDPNGGVSTADVAYLETHGTGTAIEDPMEIGALRRVFGPRDEAHAMVLGALKSNIGHTEGAAGVMGLIKTVLVLRRMRAPPNLHRGPPS